MVCPYFPLINIDSGRERCILYQFLILKGINKMRKYKFKVVKTKNNKSCIINGNSPFCLTYEKDTNVYAIEGTLGIMVFKTKVAAEWWIESWEGKRAYWSIKRVIPIGRGKTPNYISTSISSRDLKQFYQYFQDLLEVDFLYYNAENPIHETICYPGVYVVD